MLSKNKLLKHGKWFYFKYVSQVHNTFNQQSILTKSTKNHRQLVPIFANNLLRHGTIDLIQISSQNRLFSTKSPFSTSPNINEIIEQKNSSSQKDSNDSNSKTELSECKHIKLSSHSDVLHIHEKFPTPKQTLNNFFQSLAEKYKDKSSMIDISYKTSRIKKATIEWTCTYNLKWPEHCKISAKGLTKKRAADLGALGVLGYLLDSGKITSKGLPILYSKDEIKSITKSKGRELKIDDATLEKMKVISNIYEEKLKPLIDGIDYSYDCSESNTFEDLEGINYKSFNLPQRIADHKYFTNERIELPITNYKETFMELLKNHNAVIIKGEPGCGKSTRIPQYVLESWATESSADELCRIAVSEPRRIAAISLAERVAAERNERVGPIVGYQVRLQSDFQLKTGRILYCTSGILLRYLQNDRNMSRFSHVILDEAHERDLNIDLLMNLLKQAMKRNDKLKVIVMSATIDAVGFSNYFDKAPILNIPGFTYPVKRHFLDQTKLNVTKTLEMCQSENPQVVHDDVVRVINYIHQSKPEGAILVFLPGWDDISKVKTMLRQIKNAYIVAAHSKLKHMEQKKIFTRFPPGIRKIILATNVAETSITIDDVVYVVDTGLHKDQLFDNDKGIKVIDTQWVSQANVNQRAGRAGRCQPGEAYHLYTTAKYNELDEYATPKILNSSLTKVVLDSKLLADIPALDFMNSLITPPEEIAVRRAVTELKELDLLDGDEKLTPLGRTLVNFSLEPNLAKALINSVVFKCTTPIVDIVTLFSSDTQMFGSFTLLERDSIKKVKEQFSTSSDHLSLMRLYEEWLEIYHTEGIYQAQGFCEEHHLVHDKMDFIRKLKEIHFEYLHRGLRKSMGISDNFSDSDELVKAVLYSGTGQLLMHRNWDLVKNQLKTNVNILVTKNNHKAVITSDSVNHKLKNYPSDFLTYINETRSNVKRTSTVRECSFIPAISVLLFCNGELKFAPIHSKEDDASELVTVSIRNANFNFIISKEQADILKGTKEAVEKTYKYLIHQLTYAGNEIPEVLEHWDALLENLHEVLLLNKTE